LLADNHTRGEPVKIILILAITITILGGYAVSHIVSERQAAQGAKPSTAKPETPFFCDRTALTAAQRQRLGHPGIAGRI
jgi:flagellar basal body-associated protein FliL